MGTFSIWVGSLGEEINQEFLGFKTLFKSMSLPAMDWPKHDFSEQDAEDRMKRH